MGRFQLVMVRNKEQEEERSGNGPDGGWREVPMAIREKEFRSRL